MLTAGTIPVLMGNPYFQVTVSHGSLPRIGRRRGGEGGKCRHKQLLILGLCGEESETSAMALLNRLEVYAGSTGYWTVEEAPACSRQEFFVRAGNAPNNSFKPKPLRGPA